MRHTKKDFTLLALKQTKKSVTVQFSVHFTEKKSTKFTKIFWTNNET